MSSQPTLWAGVGLRVLLYQFCNDNEKIIGAITGVWNGVALHCATEDKRILDISMLLPLIVCYCYDVASSRSLAQFIMLAFGCISGFFLAGPVLSMPVEVDETDDGEILIELADTLGEGSVTIASPSRRVDRRRHTGTRDLSRRNREKTPISRMTLTPLPTSTTITRVRSHLPLSQLDSSAHEDVILSSSAAEPEDGDTTPRATQLGLGSPELNEPSLQSYPTIPSQLGSSKPPSSVSGTEWTIHRAAEVHNVASSSTNDPRMEPAESTFPHPVTVPLPSLTPSPLPPRESERLEIDQLPEIHIAEEEPTRQASPHRSLRSALKPSSVLPSLTSGTYHPAKVPLPETAYSSSRSPSPQRVRSRSATPEPEDVNELVLETIFTPQQVEEIPLEITPKATPIDLVGEQSFEIPMDEPDSGEQSFEAPVVEPNPAPTPVARLTEPSVVSIDTALESILPDGPRGRMLSRAQEIRQQAKDAEARRTELIARRVRALDQGHYTEAFALNCDIENLDEDIKRLHRKAERRFHMGNASHISLLQRQ